MFVITSDQIGSQVHADAVAEAIETLNATHANSFVLAPERTAGDEFQVLTADASVALDVALRLTRAGEWSVGCGVGGVREPLGRGIRESTGDAFVAARDAVERAKKRQTRWALSSIGNPDAATHLEAIVDLLLTTRKRRSPEGWQLYDLVTAGLTQAAAAEQLGISPQAASLRAQAADLKIEASVTVALVTLLRDLDSASPEGPA